MKKCINLSSHLQGITFCNKEPFKELQIISVQTELPIYQKTHPSIAIVLKNGNSILTTISRIDSNGFEPINLMNKVKQIEESQDFNFDTIEIRPYNFSMHPKQHISVEIAYN